MIELMWIDVAGLIGGGAGLGFIFGHAIRRRECEMYRSRIDALTSEMAIRELRGEFRR